MTGQPEQPMSCNPASPRQPPPHEGRGTLASARAAHALRTSSTSRATFSGGVCGTMPWPRLKMKRLARKRRQNFGNAPLHRRPARHQQQRIEIALHDRLARQLAAP